MWYNNVRKSCGVAIFISTAYTHNNPVMYTDSTGYFAVSILVIGLVAGAIIGGAVGGVAAYNIAKNNDAEGWELAGWTLAGVAGGAAVGAALGYAGASAFSSATGILGFSIVKGNIFVITDTIVIGHFGYASVGSGLGYGYYQISDELYNSLTPAEQWLYNSTYLKDCVTLGANFIVEPNRSIEASSTLYSEVALLIDWGYRWLEDLSALVK